MDYNIVAALLHTQTFKVKIMPFIKVQVMSQANFKFATLQLTLPHLIDN